MKAKRGKSKAIERDDVDRLQAALAEAGLAAAQLGRALEEVALAGRYLGAVHRALRVAGLQFTGPVESNAADGGKFRLPNDMAYSSTRVPDAAGVKMAEEVVQAGLEGGKGHRLLGGTSPGVVRGGVTKPAKGAGKAGKRRAPLAAEVAAEIRSALLEGLDFPAIQTGVQKRHGLVLLPSQVWPQRQLLRRLGKLPPSGRKRPGPSRKP